MINHSIVWFIFEDQRNLSNFINETIGTDAAKVLFESIPKDELPKLNKRFSSLIKEFIGKNSTQRVVFFKKLIEQEQLSRRDQAAFLVLTAFGLLQLRIVLSDPAFGVFPNPKLDIRARLSALYSSARSVALMRDYSWPDEVFRPVISRQPDPA